MNYNHLRNKGFTILELLISIAIIGILVSIAAASYTSAQKKARDSRRMSDMKAYQTALEQYYSDNNGSYPITDDNCDPGTEYLPAGGPVDPKNINEYQYSYSNCGLTSYCWCAKLENTTSANSDDGCTFADPKTYFCVKNLQ